VSGQLFVAHTVTPTGAIVHPCVSYALTLALLGCALSDIAAQQSQTAQTRTADSVIAGYARPGFPGCAVGVYQDGRTLYEGAFGLANLEHGVPIDPHRSVFNIGSVAKQFTAASILLLVQDGKVRLDDDVRKYLPELPNYGRVITIDHLLSHTSGLRDYADLAWAKRTSYWAYLTEQDVLDLIVHQRTLNFAPGSKFTYSNTGYVLLSIIVRRVSGKPLPVFANERIFAPLGMTQTGFADAPGQVTPHRAFGYAFTSDTSFEARSVRTVVTGDSKLYTTLADLAKWQRNFDDPKVGGTELIRQLEQPAVLTDGSRIDYARGLYVYDAGSGFRGLRTVTHSGGTWDGYRADVMRLADHKYSTVVLCNTHENRIFRVRDDITNIFMAGQLSEPPRAVVSTADTTITTVASGSPKELSASLVGMYWNRADMLVRTIELRDGKVWYVRSPESRTELAPIANGQWQMRGVGTRTVVEPVSPKKGPRIVRVVGTTTSVMQKVDPFSSDLLHEYAGSYANSELGDARLVFAVKDRRLVLETPIPELDSLVPAFKDALFSNVGDALFIFQRDAAGRVASVLVDTERSRDMPFTRVRGRSKRRQ
jgi:CubicO group peptidase (beta-lactamase class C family)